jgi:hypothetical protein
VTKKSTTKQEEDLTGSEVAERGTGTEVGALAYDGLSNFSARDLALPKLYKADYTTKSVKKGLVKAGSLFVAVDPDDDDVVVLSDGSQPVVFHVLALRWGKSDDTKGPDNPQGELRTYAFDDPAAPDTAWVTYTYAIVVPAYDPDIPCTVLFTKSSRGAAQKINTVSQRLQGQRPLYTEAFAVTTAERHNDQGDWFIYRVNATEAKDADIAAAKVLYDQVAASFAQKITPRPSDVEGTVVGDEPSI